MRLGCALLLSPLWLLAEPAPPQPGLVRGVLLECESVAGAGELSVRTSTHEVFRFSFDARTYFEREKDRIAAAALRPGEQVEVVADGGAGLRYARTVHVMEPPAPARPTAPARLRALRAIEHLAPAGNLTYSGVLQRITPQRIVVRLRDGVEQTILLRADTRFVVDGEGAEVGNLKPNMRVFIRAGKDLYGDLEAFQVIHGRILQPEAR